MAQTERIRTPPASEPELGVRREEGEGGARPKTPEAASGRKRLGGLRPTRTSEAQSMARQVVEGPLNVKDKIDALQGFYEQARKQGDAQGMEVFDQALAGQVEYLSHQERHSTLEQKVEVLQRLGTVALGARSAEAFDRAREEQGAAYRAHVRSALESSEMAMAEAEAAAKSLWAYVGMGEGSTVPRGWLEEYGRYADNARKLGAMLRSGELSSPAAFELQQAYAQTARLALYEALDALAAGSSTLSYDAGDADPGRTGRMAFGRKRGAEGGWEGLPLDMGILLRELGRRNMTKAWAAGYYRWKGTRLVDHIQDMAQELGAAETARQAAEARPRLEQAAQELERGQARHAKEGLMDVPLRPIDWLARNVAGLEDVAGRMEAAWAAEMERRKDRDTPSSLLGVPMSEGTRKDILAWGKAGLDVGVVAGAYALRRTPYAFVASMAEKAYFTYQIGSDIAKGGSVPSGALFLTALWAGPLGRGLGRLGQAEAGAFVSGAGRVAGGVAGYQMAEGLVVSADKMVSLGFDAQELAHLVSQGVMVFLPAREALGPKKAKSVGLGAAIRQMRESVQKQVLHDAKNKAMEASDLTKLALMDAEGLAGSEPTLKALHELQAQAVGILDAFGQVVGGSAAKRKAAGKRARKGVERAVQTMAEAQAGLRELAGQERAIGNAQRADDLGTHVDELGRIRLQLESARVELDALNTKGEYAPQMTQNDVLSFLRAVGGSELGSSPNMAIRLHVEKVDAQGQHEKLDVSGLGGEAQPAEFDPFLMRSIFSNTASNMRRYGQGRGEVRVEIHPDQVLVRFENEGDGFPSKEQAGKAFDYNTRLDNSDVEGGSTGFGNWFCREAARQMGGEFELTKWEGPVVFTLRLPRWRENSPPAEKGPDEPPMGRFRQTVETVRASVPFQIRADPNKVGMNLGNVKVSRKPAVERAPAGTGLDQLQMSLSLPNPAATAQKLASALANFNTSNSLNVQSRVEGGTLILTAKVLSQRADFAENKLVELADVVKAASKSAGPDPATAPKTSAPSSAAPAPSGSLYGFTDALSRDKEGRPLTGLTDIRLVVPLANPAAAIAKAEPVIRGINQRLGRRWEMTVEGGHVVLTHRGDSRRTADIQNELRREKVVELLKSADKPADAPASASAPTSLTPAEQNLRNAFPGKLSNGVAACTKTIVNGKPRYTVRLEATPEMQKRVNVPDLKKACEQAGAQFSTSNEPGLASGNRCVEISGDVPQTVQKAAEAAQRRLNGLPP